MEVDEITADVWRNRNRLAEKHGGDLDAIVAAMQKRERRPLTKIVRRGRPKKQTRAVATIRDA